MGILIFFVLALASIAIIAYPLLPGRVPVEPVPAVTDSEIAHAVSDLRQSRSRGDLVCPACSKGYRPGDQFCVGCGGSLPQTDAAAQEPTCPQCGTTLHEGDQFCAKCGHRTAAEEVA